MILWVLRLQHIRNDDIRRRTAIEETTIDEIEVSILDFGDFGMYPEWTAPDCHILRCIQCQYGYTRERVNPGTGKPAGRI